MECIYMYRLANQIVDLHEGQILNNYTKKKRIYLVKKIIEKAMNKDIPDFEHEFATHDF